MMSLRWIIGYFCVWLFLAACDKDRTQEMIIGHWELQNAERQGRPTSTLDGLQFEFTDDSLYTNMPVFENHLYVFSQDTLTILASNPYSFVVSYVDSVRLDLLGEIQNAKFQLKFTKIKP